MLGYAFYFVFVVAAILGIVMLLFALDQGKLKQFSEEEARSLFHAHHPGIVAGEAISLPHAVLFEIEHGFGIVRAQGRFSLIRRFLPSDIRSIETMPDQVVLRTHDFAEPRIALSTEKPDSLASWLKKCLSA